MKIVDKLLQAVAKGQTVFSYEFFPPRSEEGVDNLFERMERMVAYGPLFCDITWGAGGSTADVTLDIATRMQNTVCVETMMHLTCTNMPLEKLESALEEVRKAGLMNILALRGDPPKGQEKFEAVEGGFACALDLVKYIREKHGDYFGICVAGYPEAHPDTIVDDPVQMEKNYWSNMDYLKQKVDAGGEMIVTQLFYDVDLFVKFVKDCRSVGITVPILPGIMPIMTYGGFKRMTGFCKTHVPPAINDVIEANKDNDEALKAYGIELGAQMCQQLLAAGAPGVHMYSLNLEKTVLGILERVGVVDASRVPRHMPYALPSAGGSRQTEAVRPVFWQHRPRSYMQRTQAWTQFPSGRWCDFANPGLAAPSPASLCRHASNEARRTKALEAWGATLGSVADVRSCFERYYQAEITQLPWVEVEAKGAAPRPQLVALAQQGLLPTASGSALNGVLSDDVTSGWGQQGGRVYQKAYVEVFASPEAYAELLPKLKAAGSLTYLATKASGSVTTNLAEGADNVIAWGVFTGREVLQPLVVDVASFIAWREEAFALWAAEWGACYEDGSASRALLKDIAANWFLVHVTENDYVTGDLFKALS